MCWFWKICFYNWLIHHAVTHTSSYGVLEHLDLYVRLVPPSLSWVGNENVHSSSCKNMQDMTCRAEDWQAAQYRRGTAQQNKGRPLCMVWGPNLVKLCVILCSAHSLLYHRGNSNTEKNSQWKKKSEFRLQREYKEMLTNAHPCQKLP